MAKVKVESNFIYLIGLIFLGFLIIKLLGVANEETWDIIRDKDGRLLSIKVKRKVKTQWTGIEKTY